MDFKYKLWLQKLEIHNQFLQVINFKRVRMTVLKDQLTKKEKKRSCNFWNKKEEKNLLEFILMNPNDIIDGPQQRGKMIPELCKYIQSNKTEENCKRKIENLLKDWKTYGEIVDTLKKKSQVDDNWISERLKSLQSRGIDYLELRNTEIKKYMINKVNLKENSTWSEFQYQQILEFVLLYPQKIYQLSKRSEASRSLHSHINSTKTQQQINRKLDTLIRELEKYDDIVNYLASKTKVDEGWINERKNIINFINMKDYEDQIKNLRQGSLLLEKAHKLLIQNFDFYQAITYREKIGQSEVLLNLLSPVRKDTSLPHTNLSILKLDNHLDSIKSNQPNQMMEYDSHLLAPFFAKSEPQERIVKLRYCLFLIKYQKQFKQKSGTYMTRPLFQKMEKYTESKYQQLWRNNHERLMKKEHGDMQIIISKNLSKIYVKPQQLQSQTARIKNFYNEDFMKQMNAFMKRSKLQLKTSNQELDAIILRIKQEVFKLQQQQIGQQKKSQVHEKGNKSNNTPGNLIGKFLKPKIIFKFTTNFDITLEKTKDQQKPEKTKKKSQIDRQNIKSFPATKQLFKDFPLPSKKQKLKVKKKAKRQDMKASLVSNSQLYDESMGTDQKKNESQKCDEESQSSPYNCQGQLLSDRFEKSKKQNRQNGSKSYSEDHTVKKKGIFLKQQKIPSEISNQNNCEQKILEQPKSAKQQQMKRQWRIWSLSERIKVAFFLSVNKKASLKEFYQKQSKILGQLMDYVGTQKSRDQYISYLSRIKENHKNDLSQAIEQEQKRYQMPKVLLNQCKQLGECYKRKSSAQIGKSTFTLSAYPIIMMNPCLKSLEAEIESLIRKGPFVEASLESKPEDKQKIQGLNQPDLDVLEIQVPLEYNIKLQDSWNENEQSRKSIQIMMNSFMFII